MAPNNIVDRLPIITKVVKWFKGDQTIIDGPLFKLHYQASTFIIMVGFIFVFVENHLDVKAILCQTGQQFTPYANQYCWIHGTAYVHKHLQGRATGCFVDQSRLQTEADTRVTAYYLWLPYLLSLCFAFAKLPHSAWKRFFENELIKHILGGSGSEGGRGLGKGQGGQNQGGGIVAALFGDGGDVGPETGPKPGKGNKGQKGGQQQNRGDFKYKDIANNFLDFRSSYNSYHHMFGLWEFMNGVCVFFSMCATHWLLNYKFFPYGIEVFKYMESLKSTLPAEGTTVHDPMCELFPTEVSCSIQIGASTGGVDKSNFLCILGNNLFNQKYFLILWVWWVFLMLVSLLGLFYRLARILVPEFSRMLLMRKIHGNQLSNTRLRAADYFVLQQVLANLPSPKERDQVLDEIDKMCTENGDIFTPLNRVNSIGHNLNPSQGMYNPSVMKSLPSLYPSLSPAKMGAGAGAPSAPELPQPAGLDELLAPGGQNRRDGEGSSSSNSSHSTSTTV